VDNTLSNGIQFREPPPPPLPPPRRAPKTKGSVPDLQEEMIEAKLQLAGLRALLNLQDQEKKRERERERGSERESEKVRDEAYVAQVALPATASAATLEATGVAVDQVLPQVRSPSADAQQPHLLAGAGEEDDPDKDQVA
jgi:hypothetical protein